MLFKHTLLSLFIGMIFMLQAVGQEESYKDQVVVISVGETDLSNKQAFKFWRRTLERVNDEGAKAVIFQLDTPGGLAFDTLEIMVNELRDLKVPSYAFVDKKAISAGALISVATDEIWMTPGSTIGAAAIVDGSGQEIEATMRAKLESFFNANIRAVTQDKGHPTEIVKMMMFIGEKQRKYGPIKVPKGELLTLIAEEAVVEHDGKPILAKGIVKDRAELIETLGFLPGEVVDATPSGFEKLAWHIASISFILIMIGVGGFYFEMNSPGFGLGGTVALISFGIFFFGNFIAGNLAGYEVAAVFVVGAVLVIVELFFFPSIIVGLVGGCLMIGSLLFAMVSRFDLKDVKEGRGTVTEMFSGAPLIQISIGLVGGIVLIILMMRYLHMVPLKGFVLKKEIGDSNAESGLIVNGADNGLIGSEGLTLMDLRPVGKVEAEGKILDVITRGEFIEKGQKVRIVAKEQMRTIVEAV